MYLDTQKENTILSESSKNSLKKILTKTYGDSFVSKFSEGDLEELGLSLLNLFVIILKHKNN